MKRIRLRKIATLFLAGAGMVGGTFGYLRWGQIGGEDAHAAAAAERAVEGAIAPIVRTGLEELVVPRRISERMRLETCVAAKPSNPTLLPPFQGVLALDNDQLSRVHTRFGGEVVEIGLSTDGSDPTLRVGDQVQKGDLLAVVWSTDLGQKKSELVDAVGKLRSEEALRDRLKSLFDGGAGSGRNYRDAEKEVQTRLVEIASVERTLRTWRLTDEDIASIRAEVEHPGERRPGKDDRNDWARVEIRAPMSGVILEKNIVVGDIVDTSTDLFKIGQMSHLMVWAHVYEEDLPLLQACPKPLSWTISPPSNPSAIFTGTLGKISSVIDPVQHTALVNGKVDNPRGDLKIGQFVTVSVQVPPSDQELRLPATAVVENGWHSVVFVRPDPQETKFVRRQVHVVRRLRDEVFVQIVESGLQPGDVVVTAGALMLQNAMDQLPPPTIAATEHDESVSRGTTVSTATAENPRG